MEKYFQLFLSFSGSIFLGFLFCWHGVPAKSQSSRRGLIMSISISVRCIGPSPPTHQNVASFAKRLVPLMMMLWAFILDMGRSRSSLNSELEFLTLLLLWNRSLEACSPARVCLRSRSTERDCMNALQSFSMPLSEFVPAPAPSCPLLRSSASTTEVLLSPPTKSFRWLRSNPKILLILLLLLFLLGRGTPQQWW